MKRIVVSVSNDLVTDQRVSKVCRTLKETGHDILLIGRKNHSQHVLNRDYSTKRMRTFFKKGVFFYAEFNIRLFFALLSTKKDMLYANDLDTLLPNYLVSRLQGKELIFDSHELFSEVPEIQHKKFVKSVWLRLERSMIPRLKKVITVSNSIKNHYETLYGIPVSVVRNLPFTQPITKKTFPFSTKGKKILLYQGSTNIGRGIELMIEAVKLLDNYLLVIIGSGDIIDDLEENVLTEQLENKVKFMGKILPKELKSFTPNASIGLSLEEDLGLNYRYSLPNKLFDYIQAEVPVICSDLPDMKNLVTSYQIGEVLQERTPNALANLIEEVVQKDYSHALKDAKKELNWDQEKEQLIKLLQD